MSEEIEVAAVPKVDDLAVEEMVQVCCLGSHELKIFMDGVAAYISQHPDLKNDSYHVVHSFKSRIKEKSSIKEKIIRKIQKGAHLSKDNILFNITDLAGVRIIHIYQEDFCKIDKIIRSRIVNGYWVLGERPKAYTWDPESVSFFSGFDLNVEQKETSYTSVHYLVKPRSDSPVCCEIQVRTLFEEIWGEVDHQINYPVPSDSVALKEQLRVLSKLVGAGSRLLDSLYRTSRSV